MALTHKQQVFINEYLQCWNATEAALKAGYSKRTAYSIGGENLKKPEISAEIERRIAEMSMSADEVLIRLGKQARSSLGDFVSVNDDGDYRISLSNPNADLSLIRKLKHKRTSYKDKDGEITHYEDHYEFELHDAQSALVHIGKHHGVFDKDNRIELTWRDKLPESVNPEDLVQQVAKKIAEAKKRSDA